MQEVIMVKYGEIALKGLNKHTFEDMLIRNIKRRLKTCGEFDYSRRQSTVYIKPLNEDADIDSAIEKLKCIFGIAAIQRSAELPKNWDDIVKEGMPYLKDTLDCVPQLGGLCHIDAKQLLNIDSTNMAPEHWLTIAECVKENYFRENYVAFKQILISNSFPVFVTDKDGNTVYYTDSGAIAYNTTGEGVRAELVDGAFVYYNPDGTVAYDTVNGKPSPVLDSNGKLVGVLTAQEFALLQALMESPDSALTCEQLLRTAWGYHSAGETRTVDVHVQRLRKKMGVDWIETVYKCGYRLRLA